MQIHHLQINQPGYPANLKRLAQPPVELFVRGNLEALQKPGLAVVGSRAVTPYGKEATERLVAEVGWAKNITIISGLALGVDSLAHKAALEAKTTTIAVLPSGIERIYPANHHKLAEQIIKQGGALVSEYGGTMQPRKYNFIARNRIIAGLANAILITEATKRSGSLHTAQFGLEDNKEILAIPGSIFSPYSTGTNNLIANGAHPVSSVEDILIHFSDSKPHLNLKGDNPEEQAILNLICEGVTQNQDILDQTKLNISIFNQTLTMLEIKGLIKRKAGSQWSIV